jgi:hypothetical protein
MEAGLDLWACFFLFLWWDLQLRNQRLKHNQWEETLSSISKFGVPEPIRRFLHVSIELDFPHAAAARLFDQVTSTLDDGSKPEHSGLRWLPNCYS